MIAVSLPSFPSIRILGALSFLTAREGCGQTYSEAPPPN